MAFVIAMVAAAYGCGDDTAGGEGGEGGSSTTSTSGSTTSSNAPSVSTGGACVQCAGKCLPADDCTCQGDLPVCTPESCEEILEYETLLFEARFPDPGICKPGNYHGQCNAAAAIGCEAELIAVAACVLADPTGFICTEANPMHAEFHHPMSAFTCPPEAAALSACQGD